MEIYTTGFSGWIAKDFFTQLKDNSVALLIDIRRHPNSQLAGFTRAAHFEYFLKELSNCDYKHMEELAPNPNTLKQYRNKDIEWDINQDFYSDEELNVGEKVFHKKYGNGKILNIDGDKALVDFEKFSSKKIYMKFLKIIY